MVRPRSVDEADRDQGLDKAGAFAESKGLDADKVDQGQTFLDDKIAEPGTSQA